MPNTPVQVSTASAGGCPADVDIFSEELVKQLSSGQTLIVAGLLKSAVDCRASGINNMELELCRDNDMKLACAGEHSKRRWLPC